MENKTIRASDSTTMYQGNVTIKLMRGRKPYKIINIKNSGTSDFFKLLCHTVAGDNFSNLMPAYVSVNNNNTPLTGVSPHYTTVEVKSSEGVYYTEFTFVIPGNYLKVGVVNKIVLSNINGVEMATVELDENDQFEITDTGSNIMITWVLSFNNPAS